MPKEGGWRKKGESSLAEDTEEMRAEVDCDKEDCVLPAQYSKGHLAPGFISGRDRG